FDVCHDPPGRHRRTPPRARALDRGGARVCDARRRLAARSPRNDHGILLVIATLAGRPASGLTSILFAAAIMCGLDPPVVRDVSFQLSFAATAGIVYLASPLRRWIIAALAALLRRDEVPRPLGQWLAEPLAVTLAPIVP